MIDAGQGHTFTSTQAGFLLNLRVPNSSDSLRKIPTGLSHGSRVRAAPSEPTDLNACPPASRAGQLADSTQTSPHLSLAAVTEIILPDF